MSFCLAVLSCLALPYLYTCTGIYRYICMYLGDDEVSTAGGVEVVLQSFSRRLTAAALREKAGNEKR